MDFMCIAYNSYFLSNMKFIQSLHRPSYIFWRLPPSYSRAVCQRMLCAGICTCTLTVRLLINLLFSPATLKNNSRKDSDCRMMRQQPCCIEYCAGLREIRFHSYHRHRPCHIRPIFWRQIFEHCGVAVFDASP